MSESASEALEDPGANTSFSLMQILVEIKGGRYVGPILPGLLEDLLPGERLDEGGGNGSGDSGGGAGTGGGRSNGSSGSVSAVKRKEVGAPGEYTRAQAQ